jgi:GAF domain-containing protein
MTAVVADREGRVSDNAAREILTAGSRALARVDGLHASLKVILDAVAGQSDVESGVIVIEDAQRSGLQVAASFGLDERAAAGLAEVIRRGEHPIAKAFGNPTPAFDFQPAAPGGPALRSHVPLTVTRGGTDSVLGILALAHERPIEPDSRLIIEAAADLAAVAIERQRRE